jgi:diguanylate cyclase (GGDEF)-like protein/PAS domain S-box-containing protein
MAIIGSGPSRPRLASRLAKLAQAIAGGLSGRPKGTIAAFGIFFAVVIAVVFLADLRARYRAEIDLAEHSARNYADILAEHTALTFEAVDRSLRQIQLIRSDLRAALAAPGADQASLLRRANEALSQLQQTSLVLVAIGWTNEFGDIEAQSRTDWLQRSNIATLPHFTIHRESHEDKLYVSAPFRSAADDRWLIAVSRRLVGPDGNFAGVVVGLLDQSYFLTTYRSLDVGPHGVVALLDRDGLIFARQPPIDAGNPYAVRWPYVMSHLLTADEGTYEAVSRLDQSPRIVGYKTVSIPPVILLVSYHRGDRLAAWYQHLYTFGPGALLVISIILLGTGVLMWQTGSLARKNRILEVTLENMAHGLCMFDSEQRLIVCNSRYAQMYGLSADQMLPGTTLRAVLEARVAVGSSPEAAQEYIDTRIAEVTRGEPYYAVNELRDGRVVAVTHQPIDGGGWVAIHQDITDSRRDEEKVTFMAHHDLLTGVANRTNFMEKLEEAGARLRRRQETFTVFMLDLDRFKNVNDSLGHPAGDALLKETAGRLKQALRETDVVARLGGDEFAIIQTGEADQRGAAVDLAKRIIALISAPYDINGNTVSIGTSIGIAMATAGDTDPDTLMKRADLALYRTKSKGRNGYCFFDERMTADADARRQLEADLHDAILRGEIDVYFQPILHVKTRKLFGLEALARWRHPVKGFVPPSEFIPLAEETGLIVPLGEWILRKACTAAKQWPAEVKVAVNISAVQFAKSDLLDLVTKTLAETGLPAGRLELEITETALLENEAGVITTLQQLRRLGIAISLDDFGTGYSSLRYLTTFPIDKIKIDKSFTQNITHRADCAAVVASVLALGSGLDVATVAEGVETKQQFDILRASGVNYVQGYLFGAPCPADEIDFKKFDGGRRLENVA